MPSGSFNRGAFQKPKAQCSLKAAMLQRMAPLFRKKGMPHFIVSSALGYALCTSLRICSRMGRAKPADFWIYASMRGSVVAIKEIWYPLIYKNYFFGGAVFF